MEEQFSWKTVAQQMRAVYDWLLTGGGSPARDSARTIPRWILTALSHFPTCNAIPIASAEPSHAHGYLWPALRAIIDDALGRRNGPSTWVVEMRHRQYAVGLDLRS